MLGVTATEFGENLEKLIFKNFWWNLKKNKGKFWKSDLEF